MKIRYITGNLVASPEKVIAHGCNAQGVMKSGIAKEIRETYPKVYNSYRRTYELQNKTLLLGQVIPVLLVDRVVLNIISQKYYGRNPDTIYVSYDGIRDAIKNINKLGYDRVAFPKIGAGLANGNWEKIAAIIEENSNFEPVVYCLPE